MGMAAPIYYTADMVRALPDDGNRYEVVHGELLVTPAPRPWHQVLVMRVGSALEAYLRLESVGVVLSSPADISWARDVLVQPDLFVVPPPEARALSWKAMRTLLLAVEVLSPSSRRADRFTKRRLYQERAIPAYWVIDGDERYVEVWSPDVEFPGVKREVVSWQPAGASRPFTLTLADLLRPI
jgi:Uma2 family endonuclease